MVPAAVTRGVLLGGLFVGSLNEVVPHEHFAQGREGPGGAEIDRVWLFVLAITIHNLPEGLAVGVGFGGGDFAAGNILATGIGLQNAPEGLAVALALRSVGLSPLKAFLIAGLTGMVEPVMGLLGAWAVSLSTQLLPWSKSFAAGAMVYVISHEIILETHRHGSQRGDLRFDSRLRGDDAARYGLRMRASGLTTGRLLPNRHPVGWSVASLNGPCPCDSSQTGR
jgi:zinc transporter, ZIP family